MDSPFISAPFLMRTSMRVDHDVISFLFLCLKYAVRVGSLTDCERLWSGINLRSKLPLSDERSRFRSPKMKSSSDRSMFWMKFSKNSMYDKLLTLGGLYVNMKLRFWSFTDRCKWRSSKSIAVCDFRILYYFLQKRGDNLHICLYHVDEHCKIGAWKLLIWWSQRA
jgi:hypothetical protein